MDSGIRRVLVTQIVLCLLVGAVFALAQGAHAALAALYGGAVTLVATLWLGRGVARAGASAHGGGTRSQWILYSGALQRFVVVLVLLAVGFGVLKLSPLALIAGFVAAQFGFLLGAGMARA